ncbi:acyl transferase domain-containing protein [Chitinophaga dinghuensis]|uniref:Acyl transferase domain-containing protein n=1 Tax=Chitinophaga dinghuensis TaxID=1539050 RepID=A0A327VRX9_9BACT|nr:type I polyketide synthase [Chitinophaga dinghuensis]RAJ76800.1 acyl transferase domain-containing protein [Chitinophaga dinghuensis]
MEKSSRKKDIAIIGMSGRFPQSKDLLSFWKNLTDGKELVHFFSEEELTALQVAPEVRSNPAFVPAASFLEQSGSFDYNFFGYTKEEAAVLDPQIRIMHEQVWAALDDAGYAAAEQETIGLYLAASDNLNWRAYRMLHPVAGVNAFLASRMANKDFISTLIAYKLGLKGPGYLVDTACSGSLSAVHIACRNLLLKECSIAVAGGVSVASYDPKGYVFQEGLIASSDGHCRAFDEKASGTVWGEGAGVVVLKRFEDAIRDNDHIYAVIKASAVNNDGRRKVGYTAPSIDGQAECIRLAHRVAEVAADSISYIETHGTGTRLGDPTEIEALNKAFGYNTQHRCAIGAVKSNIGHLDAAAGVAGLIKTALALKYKQLPPSLHYTKPNPEINFAGGPFFVNNALTHWQHAPALPRRAGVSSFGIGGTNAHIVLEETPETISTSSTNTPFLLSAKTAAALKEYKLQLAGFLENNPQSSMADIAYTLATGRQHHRYRESIAATDVPGLLSKLRDPIDKHIVATNVKTVFMFPGQGTQYFRMTAELYKTQPRFREVMDKGFAVLKPLIGLNPATILGYTNEALADDTAIHKTVYTQPLLFLVEYALADLLLQSGIQPAAMIGHSLGEYVAACISGVFSLEDGLRIVTERARLMNALAPGTMLAVQASEEQVRPFLTPGLSVAAINTPGTCVLAGPEPEIQQIVAQLQAGAISTVRLNTSHAFHSAMMDDMLPAFRSLLATYQFSSPVIPYYSNLSGQPITAEQATSPEYWVSHLRHTVLFAAGLEAMLQKLPKETIFIEVGPGKTLTGLLKHQQGNLASFIPVTTVHSAKEKANDNDFIQSAWATCWKHGVKVNWQTIYKDAGCKKTMLPLYCFQQTSLPARVDPFGHMQNGATSIQPEVITVVEEDTTLTVTNTRNRPEELGDPVAPQNEIQSRLCELWRQFFGIDTIGITDDFFLLGGDSLRAMSLLGRIQKEFSVEMNIQDFYTDANIQRISREIEIVTRLTATRKVSDQTKKIKI